MSSTPFRDFVAVLALALLFAAPHTSAQSPATSEEETLAKVGPRTITSRDLLERIDLMPWPGKDQPAFRESAITNALLSLVAEKLLALEASGLGIGLEKNISAGFTTLERAFARDELFRQEIAGQVKVTPEEINEAVRRYSSELTLAVFSVSSEADARALVHALAKTRDSVGRAVSFPTILARDTITITLGTLVQAHEDVVYGPTDPHGTRASYAAASGWLVFRLLDRRPNAAAMKLNLVDRRATAENLLRKRRQAELTVHYYNRYIGGGSIRMDSALFHATADTLLRLMRSDQEAHRKGNTFAVIGGDVENLLKTFAGKEASPFVFLRSDTVRLEALLRGMSLHPVQVRSLRPGIFKEDFNRALMTVAEAELMSEWALRRHYIDHPDVRHDLSAWMEATQTQELVRILLDSLRQRQKGDSVSAGSNRGESLNEYIARLANKYGVDIDLQRVKELDVVPFNMVTRRYIGFGGTLPAVPLLPHLWEWYESWKREGVTPP